MTLFVSATRLVNGNPPFLVLQETWSHVIEMLRHYWSLVRFVFFTNFVVSCYYLFRLYSSFGYFVDYGVLSWKKM